MRNDVYNLFKTIETITESIGRTLEGREPDAAPVDQAKVGDSVKLKCNLAGYAKEDVRLKIERGVLVITYFRKGDALKRRRTVDLNGYGVSFDTGNVKATMTNGMLEIELPVADSNVEREIRID